MKKILLLLLVIGFSFSSCEKDDICDGSTPTTPQLVITFYDINNTSVTKNVTNLKIIAEDKQKAITVAGDSIFNGNTVSIPLKTSADTTSYRFILNFGSTILTAPPNEDILTFTYTREEIFVSRACGFKTNFTLDPFLPFVLKEAAVPDTFWMRYVAAKQYTIANENETHLEIYF